MPASHPRTGGVTVVMPVCGNEDTVLQALRSVERQTRPPEAVVVVDDGSKDRSADLVAEHFPAARLIRQENSGPAAARNTGWRLAEKEWVAFLDADDTWEPAKLESQLRASHLLPTLGLVACNWVPPGAAPGGTTGSRPKVAYRLRALDLLLLNRFQTSTVLVRTDVLEKTGGFDPALDGTEDWDLWLRCTRQCDVVNLEAALVRYRDSPNSYSKDGERYRASMRRMLARELPTSGLSDMRQAEIRAWHELRLAVALLLRRRHGPARAAFAETFRSDPAATLAATGRYLVPFLLRRKLRRIRPVQPLRLGRGATLEL